MQGLLSVDCLVIVGQPVIPIINLPLPPPVTPIEWVFIGLGVALTVGIVSGIYPAYKAARMRPLEALRYE